MDDKKIFGVPIDGQDIHYFKRDDILFIQNWSESKGTIKPTFYTKKGPFTICTALESAEENMPTFERFHKWNVVNKLAINQIDRTPFGYVVSFKDTTIKADISSAKYEDINLHCSVREDRFIMATKDGSTELLPLKEICYIDLPESKRGVKTPRLHTKNGVFVISMAVKPYDKVLELAQVDSAIHINIDNVKHIELSPYGAWVHFVGSDYKTTIAQQRVKFFRGIVPIYKGGIRISSDNHNETNLSIETSPSVCNRLLVRNL